MAKDIAFQDNSARDNVVQEIGMHVQQTWPASFAARGMWPLVVIAVTNDVECCCQYIDLWADVASGEGLLHLGILFQKLADRCKAGQATFQPNHLYRHPQPKGGSIEPAGSP